MEAKEKLIFKINGEEPREIRAVKESREQLKQNLSKLIQNLQWKDFEILIDLIFRQAGWQRLSDIGGKQEILDLELIAPVTGEKAIVQVKSQFSKSEFVRYRDNKFYEMRNDYDKFFYIAHTANSNMDEVGLVDDPKLTLYMVEKVSELSIASGFVDWIIKKSF